MVTSLITVASRWIWCSFTDFIMLFQHVNKHFKMSEVAEHTHAQNDSDCLVSNSSETDSEFDKRFRL